MVQYKALARVYDRWTRDTPYSAWADFICEWLSRFDIGPRLLDLCCGTGSLSKELLERGYRVAGVDSSASMLQVAERKLGTGVDLIRAELPGYFTERRFDAIVCSYDSLNYLGGPETLGRTFNTVAGVLEAGGVFVFDVNTEHKLSRMFGDSHYGDVVDDFAYVWRNRSNPSSRYTEFNISIFVRDDAGKYIRFDELHKQYWLSMHEIREALTSAGLVPLALMDDYTTRGIGPETLRATWVARRA